MSEELISLTEYTAKQESEYDRHFAQVWLKQALSPEAFQNTQGEDVEVLKEKYVDIYNDGPLALVWLRHLRVLEQKLNQVLSKDKATHDAGERFVRDFIDTYTQPYSETTAGLLFALATNANRIGNYWVDAGNYFFNEENVASRVVHHPIWEPESLEAHDWNEATVDDAIEEFSTLILMRDLIEAIPHDREPMFDIHDSFLNRHGFEIAG